eukprot:442111_1
MIQTKDLCNKPKTFAIMLSNTISLLSLGYIGVSIFIMMPLLLYRFYIFQKVKYHPIIHARRPLLLLISVVICLFCNILIIPLFLYFEIIAVTQSINIHISLSWSLLNTSFTLLIISFGIRFWQNLYDLKYNSCVANSIWQNAINSELNESKWIKYRNSIGSPKFYIMILFIFSILCFVSSILLNYKLSNNKVEHIKISLLVITFVDLIISIIQLIGLNILIKQFDDNIGFKKETKP